MNRKAHIEYRHRGTGDSPLYNDLTSQDALTLRTPKAKYDKALYTMINC